MELLFLLAVVLLSAALQTSTGFGFSILTVPLLLFVYDAHDAVKINNILSILLSLFVIRNIWREVDRGLLVRLLLGSAAGLPLGLIVFLFVPVDRLKLGIGVIILLFTALLLLRLRITATNAKDSITGGLSGFLSSAVGIPGPPLLAYSSAVEMDKTKLRSTTLAFYIFIYSASFALQYMFHPTSQQVWTSVGLSIPALIAGLFAGQWLFRKINQQLFRRICLAILLLTGLQLVFFNLSP